jgi:hypothetical protein
VTRRQSAALEGAVLCAFALLALGALVSSW